VGRPPPDAAPLRGPGVYNCRVRIFGTRDVDGRGELKPVAGWRLPASATERIVNDAKETRGIRIAIWSLVVLAMAVSLFVHDAKDDMSVFVIQMKALMVVVAGEIALLFLYRRIRDHIWMGHGLKRIQARVPDEQAVPMRYTMRREGVVTGADEGYLWLHDGTLYFKGLQSVWRLNRDDMPPVPMWPRRRRPRLAEGRAPLWLPMPHAGGRGEMVLTPIDPFEDYATRRRFAVFFAELDEWLRTTPRAHIESMLPPSDLHPSLSMSDPTRRELRWATWGLYVLNMLMVPLTWLGRHPTSFLSFMGFGAAAVYAVLLFASGWEWMRTQDSFRVRARLLLDRRVESVLYP